MRRRAARQSILPRGGAAWRETPLENIVAQIASSKKPDPVVIDSIQNLLHTEPDGFAGWKRRRSNAGDDLVVIDSIQTIYTELMDSSAGSVSQIRECAATLLKYAKSTATSIVIIGHITKDGTIAGPKILEHIVDVVLQFEGDSNNIYRILRGIKNRFGATFEIGVFGNAGHRTAGRGQPVGNPAHAL